MFFSWFEPGSIVLVAHPVQTSSLVPGSYMSRTRAPTLIVELVHDPMPMPKDRAPGVPLHFLIDGSLVTDIEIRLVAIGLGQPSRRQLCVHRLLDFRVHNRVRMRTTDVHPFIRTIFRKICSRHKVVANVLRG